MKQVVLHNLKETEEFGREFATNLKPGQVIALVGPLGAGKTTLTKSIAKGLGVTETLSSPTFTIVCEYESGRLPLYHFDVYRVHDEDELFEMGFEEYFHKGGVCLIEWADLITDLLPPNTITLKLEYGSASLESNDELEKTNEEEMNKEDRDTDKEKANEEEMNKDDRDKEKIDKEEIDEVRIITIEE